MGVTMRVVEWLREQRHDAAHLRDENLQRMPDPDIFRKAATEGLCPLPSVLCPLVLCPPISDLRSPLTNSSRRSSSVGGSLRWLAHFPLLT